MAIFLNRPLDDLLVRARQVLGMTQDEFGTALDASLRTAQRWDAGRATPVVAQVTKLAALVFPHDASLAAELAGAASETLLSLGLVPPPAPPPALPVLTRAVLVEAIVATAADAAKVPPAAARAGLAAAFARAKELGLPLAELESALA